MEKEKTDEMEVAEKATS